MRQEVIWILLMLLLALGLRAGAAVAVQLYLNRVDSDFVIAGDAAGYLEL